MPEDNTEKMLKDFDDNYLLYIDYTRRIETLIKDLLEAKCISVHSVIGRPKDRESFEKKISKPEKSYEKLFDVTDLSGIRVITYFPDEVDKVAELIKTEFEIDIDNSVDKRRLQDPDRFGYLSLHFVAKLSPDRLNLTEQQRFTECKFEIQIRSILQHTWAEIEHDLGYKSKEAIPKEVQRRFARLAGLLEVADDEFMHIRNDLSFYQEQVNKAIQNNPNEVLINQDSLYSYLIDSNSIPHELDRKIANNSNSPLIININSIGELTKILHFLQIESIGALNEILNERKELIVPYAIGLNDVGLQSNTIKAGTSIRFLCHLLILEKNEEDALKGYFEFRKHSERKYNSVSDRMRSVYSKIIMEVT